MPKVTDTFATPCFTHGTRITTNQGEVEVQDLQPGDLVLTMDNGFQPIRWVGARSVPAEGKFAPVVFEIGAVGNQRPLKVSPEHRMLISDSQIEALFGEFEVLTEAKHFVNGTTVTFAQGGDVEYFHILFDSHEVIYAEGAASESFHPGEVDAEDLHPDQYNELVAIFPELALGQVSYGCAARMCLKPHEAHLALSTASTPIQTAA